MLLKIGDLVSDWPYGEPWPNYGIVVEVDEVKKAAKIVWIPGGESFWVNSFALTKIKETDKIQLFS